MRKYTRLGDEELDRIAELRAKGYGVNRIARELGRAKSTISDCLSRNRDERNGSFRALLAKRKRTERRKRQRKKVKLEANVRLRLEVFIRMIVLHHSPEQVAERLKKLYPHDERMHVSHETIYEYVYVRARGKLREILTQSLRQRKRKRGRPRKRLLKGKFPNILSIEERPEGVLTRRIPGHWESDLIIGKDHKSALISLVERKTRYLILIRITSLDAETFARAVSEALNALPAKLRRTLTHDNGREIASAWEIERNTGMRVYLTHPRSPWERGTNENTNGLVREFFPKGTDFRKVSDTDVLYVQELLNTRPRKVLDFSTPTEKLLEVFG